MVVYMILGTVLGTVSLSAGGFCCVENAYNPSPEPRPYRYRKASEGRVDNASTRRTSSQVESISLSILYLSSASLAFPPLIKRLLET